MDDSVRTWIFVPALVIVGLAGASAWPAILAGGFRRLFRQSPEARTAFISDRRWIKFSRRFGLRWVVCLVAGSFGWIVAGGELVAHHILPDTSLVAWVGVVLPIIPLVIGVILGGLLVLRWVVDEE
ncbi:MAG TPA: hypothetical protein VK801_09940 [Caulobacteraceae bacterium]|jgi:hypothetical protein|nr:hypothetical protein [Caulobacteraceae bacterium]